MLFGLCRDAMILGIKSFVRYFHDIVDILECCDFVFFIFIVIR